VLAIIEQLVPVISAQCIESHVLPLCLPYVFGTHMSVQLVLILVYDSHLSDADHRETYESSHSVVLTIFSSHAQRAGEISLDNSDDATRKGNGFDKEGRRPLAFTEKMVPFYTNCLIEASSMTFVILASSTF
jgi:hypothetical protein